jgi:hypothetical protein
MDFGTNPYDVAFAVVAPIAALLSLRVAHRWVVFLGASALLDWAFEFGADHWVDAQWAAVAARIPDLSRAAIRQINADGASKSATLLLGFPLALVYGAVWFGITYAVRRIVRSRSKRS